MFAKLDPKPDVPVISKEDFIEVDSEVEKEQKKEAEKEKLRVDYFDSPENISERTGKPKRKYKKRTSATPKENKEPEDNENENSFAETSALTVSIALDFLVMRMPNPKELTASDKKMFNVAFTNFAKKYYKSIEKFGEEINLIIALGVIAIPRLMKPKEQFAESPEIKSNLELLNKEDVTI